MIALLEDIEREPWPAQLERLIDERLPQLRPSSAVALLCLWRNADADGYCHMSVSELASDTGLARTTVQKCIHDLQAAGLLECIERGWRGRLSVYQVTV